MGETLCVVCGHRKAVEGCVCEPDRTRLADQLTGLPRKVARLAVQLVPAGHNTSAGERVTVSRAGSPTPARIDILTLLGPGTDRLAAAAMTGALNPHIRRWRTVENVTATRADGTIRDCEVITWHQEITAGALTTYTNTATFESQHRPADQQMIPLGHDDQVGLVPPAAWAHGWARRWQTAFGHHPSIRKSGAGRNRTPPETPDAAARQRAARTALGLDDWIEPAARPDDPLHLDWQHRFGPVERGWRLDTDIGYLTSWLGHACSRHDLDLDVFASELRALSDELTRVLGERPDQQWLGRCPTTLTDKTSGTVRRCGAGIWQDPYASQVMCLRCRSVWGPDKKELIGLAIAIRRAWPVDRRRRYTQHDLELLDTQPPPVCPVCTAPVDVGWREVTARGDRERWWRPAKAVCPQGCDTSRLL